jgi:lipopolysaccharide/colanic/teichoic acid biosynthesis glycosyltransferase
MADFNDYSEAVNVSSYYSKSDLLLNSANQKSYLRMKRMMDLFGASFGILICLPLIIVIAAAIKLENPKGPVFFKQTRIGKYGRPFHMYKFRSMVSNSEEMLGQLLSKNEMNGAMFKIKDDPRVTRIGKVIRRLSLDELPQFWNVLRNDMSLVGPRPSLPREVDQYSIRDRQRLLVIPGCTGLWQVSGRNTLSFEQMVELDLQYIMSRSIGLDIVLMVKTFWMMIASRNAY